MITIRFMDIYMDIDFLILSDIITHIHWILKANWQCLIHKQSYPVLKVVGSSNNSEHFSRTVSECGIYDYHLLIYYEKHFTLWSFFFNFRCLHTQNITNKLLILQQTFVNLIPHHKTTRWSNAKRATHGRNLFTASQHFHTLDINYITATKKL